MPGPDVNGTWKIATGVMALLLACSASMWAMISVHADHPHAGSVPRAEYEAMSDTVEQRLGRIERKLDELLER